MAIAIDWCPGVSSEPAPLSLPPTCRPAPSGRKLPRSPDSRPGRGRESRPGSNHRPEIRKSDGRRHPGAMPPPGCAGANANQRVGSGGQGRNRTNDTRTFRTTERPVRREKVEDREGVFDGPTEPPSPTEPMPNPARHRRPNLGAGSMRVMELAPSRPNADRTLYISPGVRQGW